MNRTILEQKRKPPSRDRKAGKTRKRRKPKRQTAIYQLLSTPLVRSPRRRRQKAKAEASPELRAAIATATELPHATVIASFAAKKAAGKRRDHHSTRRSCRTATSSSASSSSSSAAAAAASPSAASSS